MVTYSPFHAFICILEKQHELGTATKVPGTACSPLGPVPAAAGRGGASAAGIAG